ncbi:hypothetical protein [Micromonospora endolithica]|uniref:Uncharacterized protein n=1 Tax=Micromonospora endolithica TaxID=230091 RepID=A0A3A9Z0Y8_9ACTN|nr:hypothetical protein [Micromonospora endolithica]RKN41047.1 hypothetical protein D7223_25210 [Micromonospora endolithica]TWJ24268.1 hypothetical protein JD76_04417 [Micromonospora endolithica]
MENDFERPTREAAAEALNTLHADRERLANTVEAPRLLLVAFGALGAWWVAAAATTDPGSSYEPPTSGWIALAGGLAIAYLIRRETGIRFRVMGARAGWAVAGIVATCLALFSVSLGLVSSDLRWAVTLTSTTAFLITTWLAGVAYRSAIAELHRD